MEPRGEGAPLTATLIQAGGAAGSAKSPFAWLAQRQPEIARSCSHPGPGALYDVRRDY